MPTSRRALLATPRLPAPDRDRGSLRLLDMISSLQGTGWDVAVCGLHDEADTGRQRRRLEQRGIGVHLGLTPQLHRQIELGEFQLAVLARWVAAEPLLGALGAAPARPAVIVDSVDLHFLRHARYRAATLGSERDEHEASVEFFGRELDAYAAADAVVTVSEREASLLAEVMGSPARIHVVPLSVPLCPSPLAAPERRGALFVGSFRHVPNIEAVDYLCGSVLPRIDPEVLARHPVRVAGGNLPADLADRLAATPGVDVLGWLPDLVPYLHGARMSIVPLLHGAGVKGKVLESLASGTPVVATTIALEGTGLQPGAHVVVGNDATQLASAVERLADDDDLWGRMAEGGLAHVARAHHPGVVQACFLAVVDTVLTAPGPERPAASAAGRRAAEHRLVLGSFAREVCAVTPPAARVLVVSRGDDRLLDFDGRAAEPFPPVAGSPCAPGPAGDGDPAASQLRRLTEAGAQYLAVPATCLDWLHGCPGLRAHLGRASRRIHRGPAAHIYELEPLARPRSPAVVAPPVDVAGRGGHVDDRADHAGRPAAPPPGGGPVPRLTVVVPVWSVTPELGDLAQRTVDRIWEAARLPTEVVVVDNGSPHQRDLRATTVVRWAENRGVAPAWNAGAVRGRGPYLAFVNSDVTVEPGWDEALCDAAGGRRVAFPYTDHCDGLGFRRPDKAGTAGWAFVLSRALFEELGPFDERFAPAYFEDTDYWHRAHLSGVALSPVPGARVRHARRTTACHLDDFDAIFERNRRRYEQKHGMGLDAAPPYWHRVIEDYVPLAVARGAS